MKEERWMEESGRNKDGWRRVGGAKMDGGGWEEEQ